MSDVGMLARIDRLHNAIRCVIGNLRALGYQFASPDEVLPGPEPATGEAIVRIERDAGEIPLALKLFWTRVGSVDLSGFHQDWHGCPYPDQLIVYPPRAGIVELEEYLTDRTERERCGLGFGIPIAPDALHKANTSGGMWYSVDVPGAAEDPPLYAEPHRTTFLNYLEIAIQWGGFPGLAAARGHSWPIEQITRGL